TGTPAAGTVLGVGNDQVVSVAFAPTDSEGASATATLNVLPAAVTAPSIRQVPRQAGSNAVLSGPVPGGGPPVPMASRLPYSERAALVGLQVPLDTRTMHVRSSSLADLVLVLQQPVDGRLAAHGLADDLGCDLAMDVEERLVVQVVPVDRRGWPLPVRWRGAD